MIVCRNDLLGYLPQPAGERAVANKIVTRDNAAVRPILSGDSRDSRRAGKKHLCRRSLGR